MERQTRAGGQRAREIGTEEADTVVPFRPGAGQIVSQARVDGELSRDAPIVVHEVGLIDLLARDGLGGRQRARVGNAEQESRKADAPSGRKWVVRREDVREVEVAGAARELLVVEGPDAEFRPDLDGVAATDARETAGHVAVLGAAGDEAADVRETARQALHADVRQEPLGDLLIHEGRPAELGEIEAEGVRTAVVALANPGDPHVGDGRRRDHVGIGNQDLLGGEVLGRSLHEFAGVEAVAERIDLERQAVPTRVASVNALLGAQVPIAPVGEPIGIGAGAGVGGVVLEIGEVQPGGVRAAPGVGEVGAGSGILAGGGDEVAGEGLAQDDLRSVGIPSTGVVAEAAADGQRIEDRNHGAGRGPRGGEVPGPHGVGRHRQQQ